MVPRDQLQALNRADTGSTSDGMGGNYRDYADFLMDKVSSDASRGLTDVFEVYIAEELRPAEAAQRSGNQLSAHCGAWRLLYRPEMRRFPVALAVLCWAAATGTATQSAQMQDWASLARYRDANRALARTDPRRVVFLGDSITEGWAGQPFIRDNPHFVGRGISSQTAPQMLVRFQSDVVALKPSAVHIMAGTNDIARNTGFETESEMFGYIVSLAQLAHANRIKVIIASVPPTADFPWHRGLDPAPTIRALNARLKSYAASHGFIYADYWSVLASADGGMKRRYSEDGVHPNAAGYEAMRPVAKAAIAHAMHER